MTTDMNANTAGGQPDNSELSRFMNNGGGPEPHQGSNPGAQSDPGPREVGFYDAAGGRVEGAGAMDAASRSYQPNGLGGAGTERYTGESGSEGYQGVHHDRAMRMLARVCGDSHAPTSRMEPHEPQAFETRERKTVAA